MTLESHWNGLFDVIYQLFDCFLVLVCLSGNLTVFRLLDCIFDYLTVFGYLTVFPLFDWLLTI